MHFLQESSGLLHLRTKAFEHRAAAHWTSDRVQWLTNGRDDPLSPDQPGVPALLRVLGVLGEDGALAAGKLSKYRQLNAMHHAIEEALRPASLRGDVLHVDVPEGYDNLARKTRALFAWAAVYTGGGGRCGGGGEEGHGAHVHPGAAVSGVLSHFSPYCAESAARLRCAERAPCFTSPSLSSLPYAAD